MDKGILTFGLTQRLGNPLSAHKDLRLAAGTASQDVSIGKYHGRS